MSEGGERREAPAGDEALPARASREAVSSAKPPARPAIGGPPLWAWVALALLALAFLFAVRAILLPFLLGIAIGYLLDPIADRLERLGLGRGAAALLTLAGFFVLGLLVLGAFWPLFKAQFMGLVATLPELFARLEAFYRDLAREWSVRLHDWGIGTGAGDLSGTVIAQLSGRISALVQDILLSGIALLNLIGLLLITPVAAFYLLKDWDRLTAAALALVPPARRARVRAIARDIDRVLAGFVRGQLLVMAADAVLYAAGWLAIGLPYALVLGLLAGLLAIVPFLGPLFALATALGVGMVSLGFDPLMLAGVVGVFVIVQAIEGGILSPRLVGSQVGMHPVLVLFAVFAGGELAGLVGVFLAVPVAAVVLVLLRHGFRTAVSGNGDPQASCGEAVGASEAEAAQEP